MSKNTHTKLFKLQFSGASGNNRENYETRKKIKMSQSECLHSRLAFFIFLWGDSPRGNSLKGYGHTRRVVNEAVLN